MEAKKTPGEFDLGKKEGHNTNPKGWTELGKKEGKVTPPLHGQPVIHENSVESHIIVDSKERLQDLSDAASPMSAGTKRCDFNAGALTREEVENHEKFARMLAEPDLNAEESL